MSNSTTKRKSNRLSAQPAIKSTNQERRSTRQTKKLICKVVYEKDDDDLSIDTFKPELKLSRVEIPSTLNNKHLNVSDFYNSVNDLESFNDLGDINKNKLCFDQVCSKNSQNNKHGLKKRAKRSNSKNNMSSSQSDNESFDDTDQNFSISDVLRKRQTRGSKKLKEPHFSHLRSPKKDYTKFFESEHDSDDNTCSEFLDFNSNKTDVNPLNVLNKEQKCFKQSEEKIIPQKKQFLHQNFKLNTRNNAISTTKKSNKISKNSIMNYTVPLVQKEKFINGFDQESSKEDLTANANKSQKKQKRSFKRKSSRRNSVINAVEKLNEDQEMVLHTPPLPSKLNGYQINNHSFSAKVSKKITTSNYHILNSLTTPRKREKRIVKRPSRFLSPPKVIKTRCKSLVSSFGKLSSDPNLDKDIQDMGNTQACSEPKSTNNKNNDSDLHKKPSKSYSSTMKKVGIKLRISKDEGLAQTSSTKKQEFDDTLNENNTSEKTSNETEKLLTRKRKSRRSQNLCPTPGCDSTGHRYRKFLYHYKEEYCPILHPSKKKRKLSFSQEISNDNQDVKEKHSILKTSESAVTTIEDILADIPSDQEEVLLDETGREFETLEDLATTKSKCFTKIQVKSLILKGIKPDEINFYDQANEIAVQRNREDIKQNAGRKVYAGKKPFRKVQLGKYMLNVWTQSRNVHERFKSWKLYVCEYCLKFVGSASLLRRHVKKCTKVCPPGNEIYRKNEISIFEVDGNELMYCQNLCLLSMLFIESKTVYMETDLFKFYVMTSQSENGAQQVVGYFSKQKQTFQSHNLSCILVLPHFLSGGYGRMLIDVSYHLSKRHTMFGTPERPLSELGLKAYQSYWSNTLMSIFCDFDSSVQNLSLSKLSEKTGICPTDIMDTLKLLKIARIKDKKIHFVLKERVLQNWRDKQSENFKKYGNSRKIDHKCFIYDVSDTSSSKDC